MRLYRFKRQKFNHKKLILSQILAIYPLFLAHNLLKYLKVNIKFAEGVFYGVVSIKGILEASFS